MKNLRFAFFVSILFLVGASVAPAQTQIQVNIMNGTYGQYSDLFLAKLTVDGNNGTNGIYRGSSLTTIVPHAEIYWLFPVPTNTGEVMVTANVIPGYQLGGPTFVPYDPSGGFCYLIMPNTQLEVDLLVTEDASGAHCSMQ